MGISRLSQWMKRFGFGVPTGIDIQEETAALMPSREWKQNATNDLGFRVILFL